MDQKRTPEWAALASMRAALPALSVAVLMVAGPYCLFWILFWAASDSWDFEGSGGIRRWLLVAGSRLDRLGLVTPTERPARYSVRFQEGTFPGWRVVLYDSSAPPARVVAVYAGRCTAMGLRVTEHEPARSKVQGREEASLVCEIEPYTDVQIVAERGVSATVTDVSVRVWGSD
jgi:hypothetical protein